MFIHFKVSPGYKNPQNLFRSLRKYDDIGSNTSTLSCLDQKHEQTI